MIVLSILAFISLSYAFYTHYRLYRIKRIVNQELVWRYPDHDDSRYSPHVRDLVGDMRIIHNSL